MKNTKKEFMVLTLSTVLFFLLEIGALFGSGYLHSIYNSCWWIDVLYATFLVTSIGLYTWFCLDYVPSN